MDFGAYEDLEVYDFGQDNLGALLDEGMNDLNDETFGGAFGDDDLGAAPPVGKDFDFAGSTSKFLGAGAAPPAQAKPLSPWTGFDADPLLSRHPPPPAQPQVQHSYQQPQPAQRQTQPQFRTVDEIEAEMRAQRLSATPQQSLPQGRPLTLEEVEADMLRKRQQQQQMPPQPQQPFYGGHPAHPPFQSFGAGHQPPPPPGFPHHLQQQPRSPFPPGALPPHGFLAQQSPAPDSQGLRGPPPPGIPGMPLPPPGVAGLGSSPLPPTQQLPLGTLFPPLPSQAGAPPTTATLEQQLQYLTANQHAQHPSLTGVQLQALLQQAHLPSVAGEDLIRNVEQRIREHEVLEHKRKRKAAKIAGMARHNNLMSNSDKDFITRIQVSQLVTDDPYADDFYFHVMSAIRQARSGMPMMGGGPGNGHPGNQQGGGGGNNNNNRRPTRRENAMNKMAQNVQRLVDVAKQRNKSGQLSLDGALGKIALRTRSAPRQLVQVTPGSTPAHPGALSGPTAGHALLAGLTSSTSTRPSAGEALTHRAVLAIVESIYDVVLELEQLRRVQPQVMGAAAAAKEGGAPEEILGKTAEAVKDWEARYADLAAKLWTALRVMEPLDSASPHPFIALMSVMKGKRILPRALRHLSQEQTLTLVTLILATFDTLDTVVEAPLLDVGVGPSASLQQRQTRAAVEAKTEVFLHAIISPIMAVIGSAPLRMVTGMLGLLTERNDIQKVVRSKPGIAFLTILLSRAESLNQATPAPEAQDLQQWQSVFTTLFNALSSDLPSLFPSTRSASHLPFGAGYYLANPAAEAPDADGDDEPVWRFLAAMAVCADPGEQQSLVVGVRDKVLECVRGATKGKVSAEVAALKIRNCNLLLHSLGLDSSQLTVE